MLVMLAMPVMLSTGNVDDNGNAGDAGDDDDDTHGFALGSVASSWRGEELC